MITVDNLPLTENWDNGSNYQVIYIGKGADDLQYYSSQEWLDFDKSEYTIKVWAGPNTQTSERSGTITFIYNGVTKTYSVNLAKGDDCSTKVTTYLTATPFPSSVTYSGGLVSISLSYSSNIVSTSLQNNGGVSSSSGSGSSYSVTIPENTNGCSYSLTFAGYDSSGKILKYANCTITQSAKPASTTSYNISTSPSSLSYINTGESKSFVVTSTMTSDGITSDLSWSITSKPSWITCTTSGNSVTATASSTTNLRSDTITITLSRSGKSATVSLHQEGATTTTYYAYTGCTSTYPTTTSAVEAGKKNSLLNTSNTLTSLYGGESFIWVAVPKSFYVTQAINSLTNTDCLDSFLMCATTPTVGYEEVGDYKVFHFGSSSGAKIAETLYFTFTVVSKKPTTSYTVEYDDKLGNVIKTESVVWGDLGNPPTLTTEGYTITSWNPIIIPCITDMLYTAQYTKNS